jgi:hypothetical protein
MVIGVLTAEYALLASDRMITRTVDGAFTEQHPSDMKTFVFQSQYLVAYSGIGRFGRVPMEQWVSETLQAVPVNDRIEALRVALEAEVWRTGNARRPLTFIGLGFRDNGLSAKAVPHAWAISNTINQASGLLTSLATGVEMRTLELPLDTSGLLIANIGERPREEYLRQIESDVQRHSSQLHMRSDPAPIAGLLAAVIIRESERYLTVSDEVTVVNLPTPERNLTGVVSIAIAEQTPGTLVTESIAQTYGSINYGRVFGPAIIAPPGEPQMYGVSAAVDKAGAAVNPWGTNGGS